MPPLLVMASRDDNAPGPVAAREAVQKIVSAVAEDGLYLLIAQVAAVLLPDLMSALLQDSRAFASMHSLADALEPAYGNPVTLRLLHSLRRGWRTLREGEPLRARSPSSARAPAWTSRSMCRAC